MGKPEDEMTVGVNMFLHLSVLQCLKYTWNTEWRAKFNIEWFQTWCAVIRTL